MMKHKKLSLAVAGGCALMASAGANAGIGFKAGEWDIDFSGNVNAFYTKSNCLEEAATVNLGLACTTGTRNTNIRNGLLPGALVTSAKTRLGFLDIGVTFGMYPGINSEVRGGVNSGVPGGSALGTGSLDFRQVFLTFGDKSWGTVKMGRDIGIFGANAILSDMSLLGVGGGPAAGNPSQSVQPPNTSLGRIGLGYIYTDFQPQITYLSPNWNGFQFMGGVFQGFTANTLAAALDPASAGTTYTGHDQPGFQGQLSYDWKGATTGKVWLGGFSQEVKKLRGDAGFRVAGIAQSFRGNAAEIGGKIGAYGFEGVAYLYKGFGVGTTGFFLAPVDALGNTRDSSGGYVQLTYKFDPIKVGAYDLGATKVGVSYGESRLRLTGVGTDTIVGNPALVRKNRSPLFGVYHSLNKYLTLVGEYTETRSTAQDPRFRNKETGFALGAILFF